MSLLPLKIGKDRVSQLGPNPNTVQGPTMFILMAHVHQHHLEYKRYTERLWALPLNNTEPTS